MVLERLTCTECGHSADPTILQRVCADCGMPLVAGYDLERVRVTADRDELSRRRGGMWRWREVLPLAHDLEPVTLGEGDTPLLRLWRIEEQLGLESLWLKDESQNPTGSFKARGMAAAVSMAKALGAKALCVPSAGNAGGALAAYGARAGLPVVLAMPEDVPAANKLEAEVSGAVCHSIPGTIADCGKFLAARAADEGWFDLSTLKEPYRVEGKKTMGYELAEHFGWELPEVVLYPTGGGTGLVGMAKAFDELRELGWIAKDAPNPRFVAVQAEGCAPIVDAFEAGEDAATPPEDPHTVASGLRVPTPIGDRWMLRALRASEGRAVAISDERLVEGSRVLARREGVFAAPEGGALLCALEELVREGWVQPSDRVVLFNTGTGLKYAECFE